LLLGYADASSIWTNCAGTIAIWEGSSWQIRLRHLEQTKDRAAPVIRLGIPAVIRAIRAVRMADPVKAEAVPDKAGLELAAPVKVDLDQALAVPAVPELAVPDKADLDLEQALAVPVVPDKAGLELAAPVKVDLDQALAVPELAVPVPVLAIPVLAEHRRHPSHLQPADPVPAALVRVDPAPLVTRGDLEEQPDLAWPGPGAWRVPVREVPVTEVPVKEVPVKEVPVKEVPVRPAGPLSRLVRPLLEVPAVIMAAPAAPALPVVRAVPEAPRKASWERSVSSPLGASTLAVAK
jgi:hypothetical protein